MKTIKKIEQLAASLYDNEYSSKISFFTGKCGKGYALSYYGHYFEKEKYLSRGLELITESVNGIERRVPASICGGVTGIAWSIRHLQMIGILEEDTKTNKFFESHIIKHLDHMLKLENVELDFLHGVSGLIYYLLCFSDNQDSIIRYLNKLEKLAIVDDSTGGLKWLFINHLTKRRSYNLGLAHGIPSLICILSLIHKKGYNEQISRRLLLGGIKYILGQKFINNISLFPNAVPIEYNVDEKLDSSRMGWCYGDIGIGYSILCAGQSLKNESLSNIANEILLHGIQRTDTPSHTYRNSNSNVIDASYCHGSSGLSSIYKSIYKKTMDKRFEQSSHYWSDVTISLSEWPDGIAGYKNFKMHGFRKNEDLLSGASGILLSLMEHERNDLANWQSCFLIN